MPKYSHQDCRKIFLLLFTLSMIIQVSWKNIPLPKSISSTKKLPINKSQSFLKSDVDLNPPYKIVLTQKHQIWNLNVTEFFLNCYERQDKSLFITKSLFSQSMPNKIFEENLKNPIKLDRTRKCWYLVLRTFSWYYQNRNLCYLLLHTF